ncbi:oxidoreductase [Petrotoga sp. 9PW.55.5.1]|uniref:aldo/keto reductase n=1 Tax=Petrotoga sp. 9PW.55.5.1 TaxID=1308979 RepID=UPI000DC51AAB|nr:aldo/keto reductase [Petrotoga sp. 9PW.55.5.1]RAO99819.1 oxidoreductase [Petrotoga sp. 9PW.55.5.1]
MKINVSNSALELSRIVQGMMRLNQWNFSVKETENFILKAIDLGVTTFDHADIYGNYTCESLFGEVLKNNPSLRSKIQIVTKTGIVLPNKEKRRIHYYDTTKSHIINSVDQSLKNLNTDFIDLLLIHRPDPLMDPMEIAEAFIELHKSGKVLYFGVSNFSIQQFKTLQSKLSIPIVTNQIELSPYNLEHFQNDNIYFLLEKNVNPMVWSPLAGGKLFDATNEKSIRILTALKEVAQELNIDKLDTIVYSWLLSHPLKVLPISGSGKIERLKNAIEALDLQMPRELWFKIYKAGLGHDVP